MPNVIKSIYTDLVEAVNTVFPEDRIFLGGRPTFSEGSEPLNNFVVIELPVSIEDVAAGNKKFLMQTTGVIYIFTKAKKDRTFRLNDISDNVSSIESLFPISGTFCIASDPVVLLRSPDEYGYQVTSISFNLHTRVGIFNN